MNNILLEPITKKMLTFNKQLVIFMLLLFLVNASYAEDSKILEAVENSARSWLNIVDREEYTQSWKNASTLLRTNQSESDWVKKMKKNRSSLGPVESRYLATAHAAQSLPDVPDGKYVIIQFYASYKNKALALETVTIVKEQDETWRVSEYLIK